MTRSPGEVVCQSDRVFQSYDGVNATTAEVGVNEQGLFAHGIKRPRKVRGKGALALTGLGTGDAKNLRAALL